MRERKSPSGNAIDAVREKARSLDSNDRAVIATDPSGNVVYWSDVASELFGWSAAEAIGQNIVDLTPAVKRRPEAAHILRSLRSGEGWSGSFELRHRDGTRFTAHVTDTPVYDRHGKLIGIVGATIRTADKTGKRKAKRAN